MSVVSRSVASAVIPTTEPIELFSSTKLLSAFESLMAEIADSLTSVRLIAKDCVEKDVSAEVARMVILCEIAAS